MPLTILQFPSIKEFIEFVDNISIPLTENDVNYERLLIVAPFDEPEIQLAKSKYSAILVEN